MNQPLISIIVPIYNAEKYIKRCFASIKSQTYENWELVAINDGSLDNSKIICEDLASKDCRIKLINQNNQGASIARKIGIEYSNGEYLTFVDCDDFIEINYLEELFKAITAMGTLISICEMVKHDEITEVENPTPDIPQTLDQDNILHRFFKYDFWGFWGKLYHKSVFRGIHFPVHTINEDYVVMLQLFTMEKKIAYIKTPLYHYLIHSNGLSHQKISKRAIDEFYNKLWAHNYCKIHLPNYTKYAEAQTTETCIKLLSMLHNNDTSSEFEEYKNEMKLFIKTHLLSILINSKLLFGLKLNAIKYLIA